MRIATRDWTTEHSNCHRWHQTQRWRCRGHWILSWSLSLGAKLLYNKRATQVM